MDLAPINTVLWVLDLFLASNLPTLTASSTQTSPILLKQVHFPPVMLIKLLFDTSIYKSLDNADVLLADWFGSLANGLIPHHALSTLYLSNS